MHSMPVPSQNSVLGLIGNTPLARVRNIDTGGSELYLKLESQNPGGSIKDRIALSMIEAAERDGRLQPGGTLVEATAGNTGLALALVAAQKSYDVILVIPDKMSPGENIPPEGHGRPGRHDTVGRRKRPPGLLSGQGPRHCRKNPGADFMSTSSAIPPIPPPMRPAPLRKSGGKWKAISTPSCAASAAAER